MKPKKKTWTEKQLIEAVSTSKSKAGVLKKLGLVPSGGNYAILDRVIKDLNLDTSHFTGKVWNTGDSYKIINPARSLKTILVNGSSYPTYKLKNRLFKEGLKNKICECCGLSSWRGKPIPLELHHINGNKLDNRIENLRVLCPNCHALTDNYRGKNKKRSTSAKEETL